MQGGQTRVAAGARSEAASYWGVSEAAGWFGKPELRKRTVLEVGPYQRALWSSLRPHSSLGRHATRHVAIQSIRVLADSDSAAQQLEHPRGSHAFRSYRSFLACDGPELCHDKGSMLAAQEHARDSFENLLFSLCRFHALTGAYPKKLLIVSYEFKHERFASLHAKAVRWPTSRLDFLGTPALTAAAIEVGICCLC